MLMADYPDADVAWFARNGEGRIAAFITAGEGPIPAEILERGGVEALEDIALQHLLATGVATVLVQVRDPASYRELAARGLYVYDWTDVHKTNVERTGAYELVATPSSAIDAVALPAVLRDLVLDLSTGSFTPLMKIGGVTPFA